MNKPQSSRKSMCLGMCAIIIWSFAALLAVELTNIPPFELLFIQFGIAFLIVILRYSTAKKKKAFLNFRKADLIIATIALVINQICYFTAFRYAPAAQVDLINYLWPTFLILFSSFLPKEKFRLSYLIAAIICVFGVYNLLSPDYSQGLSYMNMKGYALALGAAISWTSYNLYSRFRRNSNSANCISWACGPAALICLIAHLSFEKLIIPNLVESVLILLLGVFQIGLAFYFWERALKQGSVKILGLMSYSIPVISVMLLVIFDKADFEPRMLIAVLAISISPLIPLLDNKIKSFQLPSPNPQKTKKTTQLAAMSNS